MKEAEWTLTLRRSPWSYLRTTLMPQVTAMKMLQEETVLIQVPQAETMMKMVMMTQTHPMVMMRTQMMIQS
jgi:hypothetical protein